jgi:hypothetical protein
MKPKSNPPQPENKLINDKRLEPCCMVFNITYVLPRVHWICNQKSNPWDTSAASPNGWWCGRCFFLFVVAHDPRYRSDTAIYQYNVTYQENPRSFTEPIVVLPGKTGGTFFTAFTPANRQATKRKKTQGKPTGTSCLSAPFWPSSLAAQQRADEAFRKSTAIPRPRRGCVAERLLPHR